MDTKATVMGIVSDLEMVRFGGKGREERRMTWVSAISIAVTLIVYALGYMNGYIDGRTREGER